MRDGVSAAGADARAVGLRAERSMAARRRAAGGQRSAREPLFLSSPRHNERGRTRSVARGPQREGKKMKTKLKSFSVGQHTVYNIYLQLTDLVFTVLIDLDILRYGDCLSFYKLSQAASNYSNRITINILRTFEHP